MDRLKNRKLCNNHYLRNSCRKGEDCPHGHDAILRGDELKILRLVARMAPCKNGSGCEDVICIYGHMCPQPRGKYGKGGKSCVFGDSCRFPAELHNIDTRIVKATTIR